MSEHTEKCGCKASIEYDNYNDKTYGNIEYCHLHAKAPETAAELARFQALNAELLIVCKDAIQCLEHGGEWKETTLKQLRDAIDHAEGRRGRTIMSDMREDGQL